MALFKCKMCGGDLVLTEGSPLAECEYCGSLQTVPSADNEKKMTLFARANRLRFNCEFDKAAGVYEALVADFPEEAEAYWGLVLCKFGIEYVDDPATGKKIPTCHRSSFDSVMEDKDFEQVLENSDATARRVYRNEAKQIEELRKGILDVSSKEAPFDIFICYKETAQDGQRTLDSVLAQDIYDALTEKGYRVFFSRITLEDKLGQEYEPYIFAALNSAKVMLVVGTDYEHFDAVWVRNEWSRYLKLMEEDHSRHLIPCFRNVDAYDMPKEFNKLQAQDLGKVGAMQDLLRGIDKLISTPTVTSAPTGQGANIANLLALGNEALEQGDWDVASKRFDLALLADIECADAHLGKLMAEHKCKRREELAKGGKKLTASGSYREAIKYADDALKEELEAYNKKTQKRQLFDVALSLVAAVMVLVAVGVSLVSLDTKYRDIIATFYTDTESYAQSTYSQLSTWSWLQKPDECTQYLLQKEIPGSYPMALNYTALVIPDYVTELGDHIFAESTGLYSIVIPESVTSVGEDVFSGCSSLTHVTIDNGALLNEVKPSCMPNLETIIIGNGATSIDTATFKGCLNLTSVRISEGVTTIGDRAFSNCRSLTSIAIPDSVTSIGTSAFYNCDSLTNITLPEGVTSIGTSAFYNCDSLTSITIPVSVKSIATNAFSYCNNLEDIYYFGTKAQWDRISIESGNARLKNAEIHYNSKG